MARYGDKPEIMAIGDSLYQGVRSLSITSDRARCSPPALIASALGKSMSLPLMPRPILFDLEALLRSGGLVDLVLTLRQCVLQNLAAWRVNGAWSTEEAFDNLALGGAAISNLWADNYTLYQQQIEPLRAAIDANTGSTSELLGDIAKLWYALNACFVLNPLQGNGPQAGKSPIDQVADRKPDILFVNIGSNEGLFAAGFSGQYDAAAQQSIDSIPPKMQELAERLKAAIPPTCKVYVNSLIRPRFVPNLVPLKDAQLWPPPGDGYFASYSPNIGDNTISMDAATMAAFDQQILKVNNQSRDNMAAILGDQLTYVDIYAACNAFDGKDYANGGIAIPSAAITLKNTPLEIFFGHFNRGGFSGLDNMHPTVPGYRALASAVLEAMGMSTTGLITNDQAYAADTLLQNLPDSYPVFTVEIALLGSLGLFSGV